MCTNARYEGEFRQNLPRLFLFVCRFNAQMLRPPCSLRRQPVEYPREALVPARNLQCHHVVASEVNHSELYTATTIKMNRTLDTRLKFVTQFRLFSSINKPVRTFEERQLPFQRRKVRTPHRSTGSPISPTLSRLAPLYYQVSTLTQILSTKFDFIEQLIVASSVRINSDDSHKEFHSMSPSNSRFSLQNMQCARCLISMKVQNLTEIR
jgi:hypothetical protein